MTSYNFENNWCFPPMIVTKAYVPKAFKKWLNLIVRDSFIFHFNIFWMHCNLIHFCMRRGCGRWGHWVGPLTHSLTLGSSRKTSLLTPFSHPMFSLIFIRGCATLKYYVPRLAKFSVESTSRFLQWKRWQ